MGRTESTVASARPPPRWLIFPRCPQDAESGRQVVSSGRLFLWSWSSGGQGGEAGAGSRGEAGWGGGAGGQGGQAEQGGRGEGVGRRQDGDRGGGQGKAGQAGRRRGQRHGHRLRHRYRPAAGGRRQAGGRPVAAAAGGRRRAKAARCRQRRPAAFAAARGPWRTGDRVLDVIVARQAACLSSAAIELVHTASFVPIFNSGLYGRACFYPATQKRKGALIFWWGPWTQIMVLHNHRWPKNRHRNKGGYHVCPLPT